MIDGPLKNTLEPFEVSDRLTRQIIDDPSSVQDIEGYQGHPITGIGDVYTPPNLVNFILDNVGFQDSSPIERKRIIDLSCGTGSFIVEVVRRLRSRLIDVGYSPTQPRGARQIISTIKNNVVALDINSNAVWRTAQLIIRELREEIESLAEENPIKTLPVYHANSLLPNLEIGKQQFNFVVGNPPYIQNKDINPEYDEIYRKEYATATGKYDIYPLFFEKGLQLLSSRGKIGFVTPDRFHRTDYGEPLRRILTSKTQIDLILNLLDDPFPVVSAYPTITIATKEDLSFPNYQYENNVLFCEADSNNLSTVYREIDDSDCSNGGFCTKYQQSDLENGPWKFTSPDLKDLKEELDSSMVKIGNLPIEIRAGIATGADDIFILTEKDAKRLDNEVIFPVARGKNIKKGGLDGNLSYILNPYDENGSPISIEKYPKVNEYLSHYREKLEQRYCVRESGKRWYETHDTIHTPKSTQKRIITPDITDRARFSIASNEISHNTCYSIYYQGDLKALSAVLNSSVSEFLLKSSLPKMDDGYWRQMKRDLKDIPVLDPRRLDGEIVNVLTRAYENQKWDKVDEVVFSALGLSDKEEQSIIDYLS